MNYFACSILPYCDVGCETNFYGGPTISLSALYLSVISLLMFHDLDVIAVARGADCLQRVIVLLHLTSWVKKFELLKLRVEALVQEDFQDTGPPKEAQHGSAIAV